MDFYIPSYSVLVKIDGSNRITEVNSDAFVTDASEWGKIDEGYGDRYHHAQGNYFDKPIFDDRGIPRYRLEDGKPVERTKEEMDAEYAARPVTEQEPTDTELLLEMAADHEYRLCLMEMGVTEDDLYAV